MGGGIVIEKRQFFFERLFDNARNEKRKKLHDKMCQCIRMTHLFSKKSNNKRRQSRKEIKSRIKYMHTFLMPVCSIYSVFLPPSLTLCVLVSYQQIPHRAVLLTSIFLTYVNTLYIRGVVYWLLYTVSSPSKANIFTVYLLAFFLYSLLLRVHFMRGVVFVLFEGTSALV